MPHSEEQRQAAGLAASAASRPSGTGGLSQSTSSQSAIAMSSSSSSTATAPTLTLETTLQAYSNDPLTALEAVIQERNSLHAQNAQLWKLIEKQRSMYNAANRELEKMKLAANIGSVNPTGPSSTSVKPNGNTATGQEGSSSSKRPDRPERAEERRGKLSRTNSEEKPRSLDITSSPFSSAPKLNGSTTAGNLSSTEPQRPARTESLPTPAPVPIQAAAPLNVQKKSSLPGSNAPPPSTTPVPAVPIISVPGGAPPPEPSLQPFPNANNKPAPSPGGLGGELLPPRNRRDARESRITLPEEAARYIAQMSESPGGSPGLIGEFGTKPNRNGAQNVDTTLKARGEELLADDDDENSEEEGTPGASPVEAEVSYPPVQEPLPRERKQPPPPINAPSHGQTKTSHTHIRGVNGAARGASIDSNDMATPMANQVSYTHQQSLHSQAPTREIPLPPNQPIIYPSGHPPSQQQQQQQQPSRPQLQSQSSSGSHTRPSLQEAQRPSFSQQSTSSTITSDYPYSIAGDGGQLYRDAGYYDPTQSQTQFPQAPSQYAQPQQQAHVPQAQSRNQHVHSSSHSSQPQLQANDLPALRVKISGSQIRSNERGKDVLSFLISVHMPRPSSSHGVEEWKIEKMYSDVLTLDGKVRNALGRSQGKKLPVLPDAKLFKDNAPAKVDQRRAFLEQYLQALIHAPLKDPSDLCTFFSTDVSRGDRAPVTNQGYKEGYLTKRGKSFGGWKTRYFVLQNSVLEYFENRGGAHLGSINITGAQIGRQQKQASPDDENAYRHAFLIIEQPKKGAAPARHVLCAASDAERDEWVDVLVRSVTGSPYPSSATSISGSSAAGYSYGEESYPQSDSTLNPSRPSTSSSIPSDQGPAGNSPVDRIGGPAYSDAQVAQRMIDRNGHGSQGGGSPGTLALSSSLPSNLENNGATTYNQTRSNSSLGHYTDSRDPRAGSQPPDSRSNPTQMQEHMTQPKKEKPAGRASYHPSLGFKNSPADRGDDSSAGESTTAGSVLGAGVKKISGPLNAQPIPPGAKFGNKDTLAPDASPVAERDRKVKSGRFWPTFGKGGGNNAGSGTERAHNTSSPASAYAGAPGRAVFGVPLEQSLGIAQIANLPAIVFRCIEYLEAKKAAEEEGIYRLSGSSAVIKALKDRFNHEGDVNLLKHDDYWDPHAIAGLLKQFLRDLPTSILTRELQQRFLSVVDLMDLNERINELAHLVSQLPVANYSLLRAMTSHLILIVQNSGINKMTMRNVGIVFSPTLGIPAGILSLMLGEFDRVFNVDAGDESSDAASSNDHDSYTAPRSERTPQKASSTESSTRRARNQSYGINKRNSMLYNNTATDQMLGLGGRKLEPPDESSEGEEVTMPDDSDFDSDHEESSSRQATSEQTTSGSPPSPPPQINVSYPATDNDPAGVPTSQSHHAKTVAATRGLQINVGGARMNRASGLPASPRPVRYPTSPGLSSSGNI